MVTQDVVKKKSLGLLIGLDEKKTQEVAEILLPLLANIQALYIKTRGFHWNIEGPRFFFLHELLDSQYRELQEETDEIAERIRQIGKRAPGSLQEFSDLMTNQEVTGFLDTDGMIDNLVTDYDTLISSMRSAIDQATELEDFGTADLLTQTLRTFEKRAWMLRSHRSP